MGMLQFYTSDILQLSPELVQFAYIAGLDRVPWPSRWEIQDRIVRIWRDGDQSGYLTIPTPIVKNAWLAASTATLSERFSPYDLLIELARGRVGALSNQLSDWQLLGLNVPEELINEANRATNLLAQAVIGRWREHTAGKLAWEGLQLAFATSQQLCERYVEQAIAVRRDRSRGRIPFWTGLTLTDTIPDATATDVLLRFSDTAIGAFSWRMGELSPGEYCFDWPDRCLFWYKQTGVRRGVGPLIDLRPEGLPTWLRFDQPWPHIQKAALAFVEATVRRFRGRIDYWEVAGPLNVENPFPISEDRLATFIANAIQVARQMDPGAVIALSVRQPWLEDLRMRQCQYPAPFVVDALIRAKVGLDAVVLELALGYHPGGSYLHDALEWHRQLEYWGQLGLPLYVRFCAPSQRTRDPLAVGKFLPVHCEWNPNEQTRWTKEYFLMALAKPYVNGFLWSNWADFVPHEFAHSGLFDLTRRPKPVTELLTELKRSYLG